MCSLRVSQHTPQTTVDGIEAAQPPYLAARYHLLTSEVAEVEPIVQVPVVVVLYVTVLHALEDEALEEDGVALQLYHLDVKAS